jgi:ureidoglycolate lyase
MRSIRAIPLEPEVFAPFGRVHTVPDAPGRFWVDEPFADPGPGVRPSLSFLCLAPTPEAELVVDALERHPRTAQTFLPLEVARFLVVVAPAAPEGGPDTERAVAFLGSTGRALTYARGVWHRAMTVLDRPALMAILMGRDGTPADDEIVRVAPFRVRLVP